MLLKQQQHYRIHFFSLLLFSFLIPIHPRLATPFIALGVLNWLLSGNFSRKLKLFSNPLSLIFSGLYFIHLIGVFYSTNIGEGLRDIETKLTLFLFPLLLFSVSFQDYNEEKKKLLKVFIGGSFIASVICLVGSTYVYFTTGENTFAYEDLSAFLYSHPGYQALYMAFAMFTLIHYYFFSAEKLFNKKISIALSTFFLLMVFLFTSRTVVLGTMLLLMVTTLIIASKKFGFLKAFGITGIAAVFLLGILWLVPASQYRMKVALDSFQSESEEKAKPNVRIAIWETTLEAARKNPIIGTGTGDVQDVLMNYYQEKKIEKAIKSNYNSHNQFLQTTLALGIIGLILLLLNFVVPIILGFKRNDYLYLMFLFSFVIFSLTESSLEKQQGVLYYAFFNSLLAIGFIHNQQKKSLKKDIDQVVVVGKEIS